MHIGNLGGAYAEKEQYLTNQTNAVAMVGMSKPRTLRDQIQDRIAGHEAQIVSLKEALDALTPDVERALNALAKI